MHTPFHISENTSLIVLEYFEIAHDVEGISGTEIETSVALIFSAKGILDNINNVTNDMPWCMQSDATFSLFYEGTHYPI